MWSHVFRLVVVFAVLDPAQLLLAPALQPSPRGHVTSPRLPQRHRVQQQQICAQVPAEKGADVEVQSEPKRLQELQVLQAQISRLEAQLKAPNADKKSALVPAALTEVSEGGDVGGIGSVPTMGYLMYRFEQLVYARAGLALGVFFVALLTGGGVVWQSTHPTFELWESTWKAYSLLNDIPGADVVHETTAVSRAVAASLHLVGVLTFAILLGLITDKISTSVEGLRSSNEPVLDIGHTVLLNWGAYSLPVIRQLAQANKEGRLDNGRVVVLSEQCREEVAQEVKEELTKLRRAGCGGLEVLTREGSPEELGGMLRVSAGTARRVIFTEPDEDVCDDAESQLRRASGLMLSLQQNAQPVKEKRGAVVLSTPADFANGLAQKASASMGSYAEVAPSSFVSRLLAQCTVQRGLSHVFEELLLQGAGNELYITDPVSEHQQLEGKTFDEAATFFPAGCVLGLVAAASPSELEGHVLLSPPGERLLEPADKLIVLADDSEASEPSARATTPLGRSHIDRAAATRMVPGDSAPQNLVILNWNPKMRGIISQIDEVAAPGSVVTVLSRHRPAELEEMEVRELRSYAAPALTNLKVTHVAGDASSLTDLAKLECLARADSVLVLQRGEGGEADDAHSLLCIHAVQQALADAGTSLLDASAPRLIGELSSPEMEQLICEQWPGAAEDFVLPRELASGTLVQFALQPELAAVFLELLSAEGKEICFMPAEVYVDAGETLSFLELNQRARARGEVAVGLLRSGESMPELNPNQVDKLTLNAGDQLVVLGELF